MKKSIVMNKKKPELAKATDQHFVYACNLYKQLDAITTLTVEAIFNTMSVESLESIKQEFEHGKAHIDKKVQQVHTHMPECNCIAVVVNSLNKTTDHMQKMVFEAFVHKFGNEETGSMKAIDIIHAIDTAVAVKKKEEEMKSVADAAM